MGVIAKYLYEVRPGRNQDFFAKLRAAALPQFVSPVMPKSVRLMRITVPGPVTQFVLMIEYNDMAEFGERNAFENNNAEWLALFEEKADAPQRLLSVELLTDVDPSWTKG